MTYPDQPTRPPDPSGPPGPPGQQLPPLPGPQFPERRQLSRRTLIYVLVGLLLSIIAIVLLVIALTGDDGDDSDSETAAPGTAVTTTTAAPSITVITPEAPPVAETTPATVPPAPEPQFPPGFPSPEQWQAFRQCQTGGDYSAVNEAGTNFGAYQFRTATWDELAGRRFPELVGVLPSEASPVDQDKMGFALWEERGVAPWPDCAYTISDADPPSPPAEAEPAPAPAPAVNYDPNALGPAVEPAVANFPSQAQWQAFRNCQTGGDYTVVSPGGTNFGAYQFRAATWDELAGRLFPSLVGVLPSQASPADQDRMAYAFWQENGVARWPGCGFHLEPETTTAADTFTGGSLVIEPPSLPPITGTSATAPESAPGVAGAATARTSAASSDSADSSPAASVPTAQQWENLRQCESWGDYTIVSSNGLYYGAYQFEIRTWDDVAGRHAPQLVGTLPSAASPQDQDFLAQKLYDERGWQPWPVCGALHLA